MVSILLYPYIARGRGTRFIPPRRDSHNFTTNSKHNQLQTQRILFFFLLRHHFYIQLSKCTFFGNLKNTGLNAFVFPLFLPSIVCCDYFNKRLNNSVWIILETSLISSRYCCGVVDNYQTKIN